MNRRLIQVALCLAGVTIVASAVLAQAVKNRTRTHVMPARIKVVFRPTIGKKNTLVPGAKSQTNSHPPRRYTKHSLPPEVEAQEAARLVPGTQMMQQARSLMRAGDLSGAERVCLEAVDVFQGTPSVASAQQLLGEIYLAGGQNEKALRSFHAGNQYTQNPTLSLDVALAYCRLGNYEQARRFYSDQAILQYHVAGKDINPQDLPGTDSPQSLEASILLARGIDAFFEARKDDALADFATAAHLGEENPLIHYYNGMALLHQGRYAEAAPHFQAAASSGHGPLAKVSSEQFLSTRNSAQAQQPQEGH